MLSNFPLSEVKPLSKRGFVTFSNFLVVLAVSFGVKTAQSPKKGSKLGLPP